MAGTPEERMKEQRHVSGQAIRETVGTLAVVASLIFVGFEIRQNTAVARAQARHELADLSQDWLILMATDTLFAASFYKAWVFEDAELTPTEGRSAHFGMMVHLRRLENVYFQFKEGMVDASALGSYGFQTSGVFRTTKFIRMWQGERQAFDDDFVAFFEKRFGIATK
jgi:hypothetical protein